MNNIYLLAASVLRYNILDIEMFAMNKYFAFPTSAWILIFLTRPLGNQFAKIKGGSLIHIKSITKSDKFGKLYEHLNKTLCLYRYFILMIFTIEIS